MDLLSIDSVNSHASTNNVQHPFMFIEIAKTTETKRDKGIIPPIDYRTRCADKVNTYRIIRPKS
ncbi:hypothetical protein VCR15J2_20015 [Vibrio coralliirubri]|nr:hypothetical protein VCR15J2_20015 [Vibrio coralliirubri]